MNKIRDKHVLFDDEDEDEYISYKTMVDEFFHDMVCFTRPNHKHTLFNSIKDICFVKVEKIHPYLKGFCEEKIENVFDYAYERKLKSPEIPWSIFGHYMWLLLYRPQDKALIKLPKEVIDFALEQFENKQITLEKIDDVYTVVFLGEDMVQEDYNNEDYDNNEEDEEDYIEKEISEDRAYNVMVNNFFLKMKIFARPKQGKTTWWDVVKLIIAPKRVEKIDSSVEKFFEEKLENVFDYVYSKKLKPEELPWKILGEMMWEIVFSPEYREYLNLPKDIVNYAVEQFEEKRITVEKVDDVYTVVFLEEK